MCIRDSDKAVKALDELSADGNQVQVLNEMRSQLLDLKNSVGTKPEREIAESAVKAIVQPIADSIGEQNPPESIPETLELLKSTPWIKEFVKAIKSPWFELTLAARNSEIDLNNWRRAKYKDLVRLKVKGKTNGKEMCIRDSNCAFQFSPRRAAKKSSCACSTRATGGLNWTRWASRNPRCTGCGNCSSARAVCCCSPGRRVRARRARCILSLIHI